MSRLIDADKLDFSHCDNEFDCIFVVNKAPTVDAIEVVRCKNCKHQSVYCTTVDCNMKTTYSYFCVLHGTYHEHDWFCADGERRNEL